MLSTISSMNRLSNSPSLASSTVSRAASCSAGPTSTRMSGEPITLNSTCRWSWLHGFVLVEQSRLDREAGRRVRHDALLDSAALTDGEQLRVADVVAAKLRRVELRDDERGRGAAARGPARPCSPPPPRRGSRAATAARRAARPRECATGSARRRSMPRARRPCYRRRRQQRARASRCRPGSRRPRPRLVSSCRASARCARRPRLATASRRPARCRARRGRV